MIDTDVKLEFPKYLDEKSDIKKISEVAPVRIERLVPYEKGDLVRVQLNVTEEEDSESYYYIKEFEKKRGEVIEVIMQPRLQYRVRFNQQDAILYHEELTS